MDGAAKIHLRMIRLYASKRDRALKAADFARKRLADNCKAAEEAGVPVARIAIEAGLSRQAIYDLLKEDG